MKCCLLLFCGKTTWDCDQIVMCNEKWIVYDNQWWLAQWSGWEETPKHFLKPNLHKMRSWSLFRGLLPIWSTTAFWTLAKPLHLWSMLNKPMRCMKNCNACSQHWSTEWAWFFSMTMPDCTLHNQRFRSWSNWALKFCLIHHNYLTAFQLASSVSTTFGR